MLAAWTPGLQGRRDVWLGPSLKASAINKKFPQRRSQAFSGRSQEIESYDDIQSFFFLMKHIQKDKMLGTTHPQAKTCPSLHGQGLELGTWKTKFYLTKDARFPWKQFNLETFTHMVEAEQHKGYCLKWGTLGQTLFGQEIFPGCQRE